MNEPMKVKNAQDHVKSAIRALEILEFFDDVRCPQSIVNIARALNYPHSSATTLLRSLVSAGYLHFNSRERTYFPSERVPFLGSWLNPPLFENAALPRMARSIRNSTRQLVAIASRNGDVAQYIHVLNEPKAVEFHIKIGQKRSLAGTGVGLVLLSTMQDRDIKKLYHRVNAYANRPSDKIDIPTLLSNVELVRRNGYVFTKNRLFEGIGMISMPIPTAAVNQALAVGVAGKCEQIEKREAEIVRRMRSAMMSYLKIPKADFETRLMKRKTARIPAFASTSSLINRSILDIT